MELADAYRLIEDDPELEQMLYLGLRLGKSLDEVRLITPDERTIWTAYFRREEQKEELKRIVDERRFAGYLVRPSTWYQPPQPPPDLPQPSVPPGV